LELSEDGESWPTSSEGFLVDLDVSPGEEAGKMTGAAAAPVRGEDAGCTECIAELEVPVLLVAMPSFSDQWDGDF
jgi:hypothetical protein